MISFEHFDNKVLKRYDRKKKLSLFFVISIIFSTIFIYTYVINSPINQSHIPKININTNAELYKDDYANCTIELEDNQENNRIASLKAKIKLRGSDSKEGVNYWPKKEYRLELNRQVSLLDMRKDDDWILLALYVDFPRMRIKYAMDLWRSLDSLNPTAILPESRYVNLYMNGEYQGLYLLAEKNDRKLFGLKDAQNNINSSLIIQAKTPNVFRNYMRDDFEQDWPNEDEDIFIMDEIMINLFDFINNASDAEFFDPEKGIYSFFNKQNLIDFFIYNLFILHEDFWYKNYFIIRNTYPSKFFLIPWDFDHSLGEYGGRKYESNRNLIPDIRVYNVFFKRLVDNKTFMQECTNRWYELREVLWTEEFLMELLVDIYKEIDDIIEYDANKWNPTQSNPKWDNIVKDSIDNLFQWIPERLEYCDSFFEQINSTKS